MGVYAMGVLNGDDMLTVSFLLEVKESHAIGLYTEKLSLGLRQIHEGGLASPKGLPFDV